MKLYKGSVYPINVAFAPCYCQDEEVALSDLVINFFTTDPESSIEFSGGSITVSGFVATVVFQPEQLDSLEDGVLRFISEFNYGGSAIKWSCATDKYLVTPPSYTPLHILTEDNIKTIASKSLVGEGNIEVKLTTNLSTPNVLRLKFGSDTVSSQSVKTINGNSILGEGNIEIQGGGGATTGEVRTMIDAAISAETARTESTYLKEHQSLANYYTSAQTQEYVSEAIFDLPTRTEVEQSISSALTDYSTTAQMNSAISAATQNKVSSTSVTTIWRGTQAQYNAIAVKDNNTLYFVSD